MSEDPPVEADEPPVNAGLNGACAHFEGMYGDLLRLARVVAPCCEDAQDIVQTALVRSLTRHPNLSGIDNPGAYLYRVVVREASRLRQQQRRIPRQHDTTAGSEHLMPSALGMVDLNRALDSLAPRQRACLYLRFVIDLSVADTAELLGCSEGTVKSQTAKATRRLAASRVLSSGGDDA
jgi:RNA polymerase sigma factor (sigma-70 family)